MNPMTPGMKLPDSITKNMAWTAFDYIFSETDWRLRFRCLDPVSFNVEYDDTFASCLSASNKWQSKHQALSWIANRVLELALSFDKTYVRRFSLQVPATHEAPMAEPLLSNLERRIRDTVLDELVAHFDSSIAEWEQRVKLEVARIEDAGTRWRASRYLGLDQVVSVDAARKALRFIFSRTHWHLTEVDGKTVLNPDWRFEQVRAQRSSLNEQTRARSLVASCIEVLVEEHVQEQRIGVEVAPMTRLRLKCEIERIFGERGVWALIELVLPRDRSRHYIHLPHGLGEELQGLISKQEERIGMG